jgi:ribosomal-protein-serine acetyltransferase
MENIVLKDGEIELIPLRLEHTSSLFKLVEKNRDYLRVWLPWVDKTKSEVDQENFIKSAIKQHKETTGIHLGIWYQKQIVGVIGFHAIHPTNKSSTIGYWLAESSQGKGIMTKAVKLLIEFAFAKLKLHRVEIQCATENLKSCAIPERLNFKYEGTLRQAELVNDKFYDIKVYGLLAREYFSKK